MRNIQAGTRGEEEVAYEMKVHWGESKNWMIINDLRIVHNDLVAQIDHLIINRWLDIWVCESKHFSEGIGINDLRGLSKKILEVKADAIGTTGFQIEFFDLQFFKGFELY